MGKELHHMGIIIYPSSQDLTSTFSLTGDFYDPMAKENFVAIDDLIT